MKERTLHIGKIHWNRRKHRLELMGKTTIKKDKTMKEKGIPLKSENQPIYLRRAKRG